MDLTVDTDGIRAAARLLSDAETSFRGRRCVAMQLADDAAGPTPAGREAADLLLRRARQVQEALTELTELTGSVVDLLVVAAATFDRAEAALVAAGPR